MAIYFTLILIQIPQTGGETRLLRIGGQNYKKYIN